MHTKNPKPDRSSGQHNPKSSADVVYYLVYYTHSELLAGSSGHVPPPAHMRRADYLSANTHARRQKDDASNILYRLALFLPRNAPRGLNNFYSLIPETSTPPRNNLVILIF